MSQTNEEIINNIIYPFFDETIEGERYISKLTSDLVEALEAKDEEIEKVGIEAIKMLGNDMGWEESTEHYIKQWKQEQLNKLI